ncbi:hypothetical protein CFC21_040246 [Triticum aestivum]|uniref:DUF1664 domain-containing protein n=2 Tax=Triticum aestivum TaxID=4565 RepID=A0A9R1FGC3_WHEAT|nr:uncharacterized protein LOC119279386 [Triticum dicoccoides]XP_044344322.1 uncharacterized protein LOC123065012 [Triticum aestivum]KAF7028303.1 hypothetical protein CFC21_040246 [Triticum aestivum]CDM81664.1 unnamed protein product [Triticum aestivum]
MATASVHLGRYVLLAGVGFAAPIVLGNGRAARFSDILKDFQEFLREKGVDSSGAEENAALHLQLQMLAREVRHLSMAQTIVHIDPGNKVLSAFIAPAAAAGVAGYAYMWWKGISFSSIMYVTKQNMANAVSSMTKHLEQVQNSLAAAKRHLTQRIQRLDDKLDKQKEMSGQIRDEVAGARIKLKDIGAEMENLKKLAFNMDGKLDSIQDKQDCQLAGVSYLLQFIEPNVAMLPNRLEGLQRPVVTRSMKQGELPGLEFGLRLLALEQTAKGAGLALSSLPVKSA